MNRDEELEANRRERGGRFGEDMGRGREDRPFGAGRYGREDRWGAEGRFGGPESERWRDERRGYESGFGGDNRFSGGEDRWGSRGGWDRDLGDRGPAGWGGPQWGNEPYAMRRSRSGGYGGYGRFDEGRGWDYGERGSYGGYGGWGNEGYTAGRDYRGGYSPSGGGYGMGSGYGMSNRSYGGMDLGQSMRRRMGRGPKGYQRSDERIREDVCDMMSDHDWLDASDIDVTVKNCEVTLTGTVSDRESKRMAEDLAERARGVKDVHNQLRVKQEESRGESQSTTRSEKQPRA